MREETCLSRVTGPEPRAPGTCFDSAVRRSSVLPYFEYSRCHLRALVKRKDTWSRKFGLALGPILWFAQLGKDCRISLNARKRGSAPSFWGLGAATLTAAFLGDCSLLRGSSAR